MKEKLKQLIQDKYMKKGEFLLSSGKKSNLYFDIKSLMLDPKGAPLIAQEMEKLITLGNDEVKKIIVLGGLELGAALLAPLMAYRGFQTFVLRKNAKNHGLDDGKLIGFVNWGSQVMLIDDVITTGNSVKYCEEMLYHVCNPFGTACVIDRTGESSENRKGKYVSLFRESDFL